jgi:hypothetical protein
VTGDTPGRVVDQLAGTVIIARCAHCVWCAFGGELSALPAAVLAAWLAEAYRLIAELTGQVARFSARVDELGRQARRDSSTSSRPPSSDCPYRKKDGNRSLRERGKRRPGKQPGDPGSTMSLVDDPDETIECPPPACRGCGADLAFAPVTEFRNPTWS